MKNVSLAMTHILQSSITILSKYDKIVKASEEPYKKIKDLDKDDDDINPKCKKISKKYMDDVEDELEFIKIEMELIKDDIKLVKSNKKHAAVKYNVSKFLDFKDKYKKIDKLYYKFDEDLVEYMNVYLYDKNYAALAHTRKICSVMQAAHFQTKPLYDFYKWILKAYKKDNDKDEDDEE